MSDERVEQDLSNELWREYSFGPALRVYRINEPKSLKRQLGGCTHNVIDAEGISHTLPNVMWGDKPTGCVITRKLR